MCKTRVNWGILGCARIAGNAFIPGIKNSANSTLYAISSRSKERLEEFKIKHNPVKAYESYEALLDDPDIDAVYIPLPNSLHYQWVLKAAEKKKHILCEKPLACTKEEVAEMKSICESNGVLLMEAYAYRHSPVTFKLKELIEQQAIGKVKLIEAYLMFTLDDKSDIRMVKELGGGAIFDVGCYPISMIRYLAGSEPVSILASGEIDPETGVDMNNCGILEFKDGVRGIYYCAFDCVYRNEYKITGESGVIEVAKGFNADGEVEIVVKKGNDTEVIKIDVPSNYLIEVESFANCILNGEKPLVSLEDSYNNAVAMDKVIEQIYNK